MRSIGVILAAACGAAGLSIAATAQPAATAARISVGDFAKLPILSRPILSGDGKWIAARAIREGHTDVALLDSDRPEAPPRMIRLGDLDVSALRWAGSKRLLITVRASQKLEGEDISFLRLVAVDIANGASRFVDPKSRGIYAGDVIYADPSGDWALVVSQDGIFDYPSVKRVDLSTGAATLVEKARDRVWDWYADDTGVVRAGIMYEGRRWTVWYRDKPEEKLRALRGKFSKDEDSAVDRILFGRGDHSWIVTNERTGRFGLYKYDLKAGAVGEPVFEHAEVDLDEVHYDPLTGQIDAVEYEDDRRRVTWFDADMKSLQTKLDRALPNAVNITTGWSRDKKRALVWSSSGSDPGRYFLLDRTNSKMHAVVEPYPHIDPERLAPVTSVRYSARDGLGIPAFLTLPTGRAAKSLPLIVFPHGGPFLRDHWEYDATVQFLASRGYAVLQPQFRGSTGYGKDFVTKGFGEWGRKMQDDLDDGVDWLAKSGRIDPKRVCIVGSSYGGYAALWGAIRNPERYRCAASMAGISDVAAMLRYDRRQFAAPRYFKEWRTRVSGEGKGNLAEVSPIRFVDRLSVPLFIAHGEKDDNVPPKQSRQMVEMLKARANVTSAFYKDSGHGFDTSADFEDWLRRLEAFLAKHNPA